MLLINSFPYVLAGFLLVVFVVQLIKPRLMPHVARPAFFLAFIGSVAWSVYASYLQYQAFNSGVLGFTLSTTDGIKWFLGYSRLHFWNTYLISLIAALAVILFATYANRKKGKIFFEDDELYLGALGIFAVGYPGIFAYLLFMLIFPAIGAAIFLKKGERMPLYHFWMPVAIAIILAVQFWGVHQPWWNSFRF